MEIPLEIVQTEPLIYYFIDLFNTLPDLKKRNGEKMFTSDSYILISSSIFCKTFYSLYLKLIQIDVAPIETLSDTEKTKYWNIAKRYHTDQDTAIKASKAAYMITLLNQ